MAGIILGLMLGVMGVVWFAQQSDGREQKPPRVPVKSQMVIVDSVTPSPVVCKPMETDEARPLVRNLTQPFEYRQYVLEPGEKCSPE